MKVVGITGGIGSGKTTAAQFFSQLGVPVYTADHEAKVLMSSMPSLIQQIKKLFGNEAYKEGKLNRAYLAESIFSNQSLREQLNAIVHPEVHKHFEDWKKQQLSPYVLYEAAILIENKGYENCDYVILVVADKNSKVKRIQQRDQSSLAQIEARMNAQWSDDQKKIYANFVLENTTLDHLKSQVDTLHKKILSFS